MAKIWSVGILFIISLILGLYLLFPNPTAGWSSYKSKYITFKYPQTWQTISSQQTNRTTEIISDFPIKTVIDVKQFDTTNNGGMIDIITDQNGYVDNHASSPSKINGQNILHAEFQNQGWLHQVIMFQNNDSSYTTIYLSYKDNSQKIKYEDIFKKVISSLEFL